MAFETRYGHLKYQVIPFGLTNILAIFQSYIHKILAEKLNVFIVVYLDHILIDPKSERKEYVEAI